MIQLDLLCQMLLPPLADLSHHTYRHPILTHIIELLLLTQKPLPNTESTTVSTSMLRIAVVSRVVNTDVALGLARDSGKSSTELRDNANGFAPLIGWESNACSPYVTCDVADALSGSTGGRGRGQDGKEEGRREDRELHGGR